MQGQSDEIIAARLRQFLSTAVEDYDVINLCRTLNINVRDIKRVVRGLLLSLGYIIPDAGSMSSTMLLLEHNRYAAAACAQKPSASYWVHLYASYVVMHVEHKRIDRFC